MEVLIDNRQNKVEIDSEIDKIIREVIDECLDVEGQSKEFEISVSFVDNCEIRKLNKDYRNVDSATDVLSFPMSDDLEKDYTPLLGDIVISIERALEQSIEFGHPLKREIAYLTAHSMFHLLGYDHISIDEKNIMREKEKLVMKNLGIFKNDKKVVE